jgi:hypothetical protein
MRTYVVGAQDRPRLAVAEDPTAADLTKAIAAWTRAGGGLCLACDTTLGPNLAAAAHVVWLPFASHGHAMVTGVCPDCAARDDLEEVALQRLRAIFPDAYQKGTRHAQ